MEIMTQKVAVILFNLGGPDSPAAIAPFLYNFFSDKNIIRLPWLLRKILAFIIAFRRSRNEARKSYAPLGGRSPLLENTQAQAQALEKKLGGGYRVFVCMRYWHPMADKVAAQVKIYAPDKIILLPLYPQYSTTTSRSSLQTWRRAAHRAGLSAPEMMICCYPRQPGFIAASVEHIRKVWTEACNAATREGLSFPRLLFSAHGLPENIIRDGDPYQWQCEISAEAIAAAAGIARENHVLCYQSRVGRLKWIGPSTEDEIIRAGRDKVPVVVYPHAFVNEHVETLVEIEEEYRHLAEKSGVPLFYRVPTAGTDDKFIGVLADMVKQNIDKTGIGSAERTRICPAACCRCGMEQFGDASC
jgi:protoporphyrin/coproporphyrin ferrochelatase